MRYRWCSQYDTLFRRYLKKYFKDAQGITSLFPYMKTDFKWKGKEDIADSRTILKSNNEYHGLERHARQYHVAAMYDVSAEHWLLAAAWRRGVMKANRLTDARHLEAIDFALKNYRYNCALHRWQKRFRQRPPAPEKFGLSAEVMKKKDLATEAEINAVMTRAGKQAPYPRSQAPRRERRETL